MRMRCLTAPAAAALAIFVLCATASATEPVQATVCPSQAKAEQVLQSQGHFVPDDCRTLRVTRVDSPAGPLCVMDFSGNNAGILGALKDAVATTQWWAACAALHGP